MPINHVQVDSNDTCRQVHIVFAQVLHTAKQKATKNKKKANNMVCKFHARMKAESASSSVKIKKRKTLPSRC